MAQTSEIQRNPSISLANPLQIPIRRHSDQQLMLNALINLKLRVCLEVFPNRSFWIIAWPPRTIQGQFLGHVFNHGVEGDAIAAHAG